MDARDVMLAHFMPSEGLLVTRLSDTLYVMRNYYTVYEYLFMPIVVLNVETRCVLMPAVGFLGYVVVMFGSGCSVCFFHARGAKRWLWTPRENMIIVHFPGKAMPNVNVPPDQCDGLVFDCTGISQFVRRERVERSYPGAFCRGDPPAGGRGVEKKRTTKKPSDGNTKKRRKIRG